MSSSKYITALSDTFSTEFFILSTFDSGTKALNNIKFLLSAICPSSSSIFSIILYL